MKTKCYRYVGLLCFRATQSRNLEQCRALLPVTTFSTSGCRRHPHSHTCAGGVRTNPSAQHLLWFSPALRATSPPRCSTLIVFIMEDQRYPISVRMIGVLHKEKSKVSTAGFFHPHLFSRICSFPPSNIHLFLFQMYMTSVLWSDQNDIVVYRTLREFKKVHVSMLL